MTWGQNKTQKTRENLKILNLTQFSSNGPKHRT